MKFHRAFALSLAFCAASFGSALPSFSQSPSVSAKPRIVVFGFLNLTGDSSFTIPAETATENLSFSLKLLNRYETVASDLILRDLSDARLARYCASEALDFILYGTLSQGADGAQTYELALFDRQKGSTTVRESARGESAMDVFDIADRLSASVLGTIIGRRLTFGSIRLANSGKAADFDAYVDGVLARSGEGSIDHVPDGPHEVRLVRKGAVPAGTLAALDRFAVVPENATATVSFEFEPLSAPDAAPPVEAVPAESVPEPAPAPAPSPNDDSAASAESQSNTGIRTGFMFGAYGSAEKPLADFGDLLTLLAGGGVSAEYAGRRAGLIARAQGCVGIPEDGDVAQYLGLSATGGAFVRFPSRSGTFEIRPELDAGAWCHVMSLSGDHEWSGARFDPAARLSLAFRAYAGPVGFELAPFALALPEKSVTLVTCGVRAGIVVGGKR